MQPAIRVDNLAKQYQLGERQAGSYRTLRESLVAGFSRPFRKGNRRPSSETSNVLWALKDVSFEVESGEVIGIIGGNGAGKSTLLKILSRVTEPTAGRVEIRGRVGSLLEVGTGFHPELTGRENVYLSGAILGMSRREIARQFDRIVEFAGIERFLDTPVKRYSSGMYVRLAFAVAAHLDPEVLIVDEVLSVGDAEFQKKCLGKMQDVSHGGRTVFFVSHNLEVVQRLCSRVLLMRSGRLLAHGTQNEMITRYLASSTGALRPHQPHDLAGAVRNGTQEARFLSVAYSSETPAAADRLHPDGPAEVTLVIESNRARQVASLAVTFWSRHGVQLVNADSVTIGQGVTLRPGHNRIKLKIEQLHLKPGTYLLGLWLADFGNPFDHLKQAAEVEVVEHRATGLGARPNNDGCVTCSFTVEELRME